MTSGGTPTSGAGPAPCSGCSRATLRSTPRLPRAGGGGESVPVGSGEEGRDAIYGDEPVTAHMKRLVRARSIHVGVAVGPPIDASGTAVRSLAVNLQSTVQALVHQARAIVGDEVG